MARYTEKIRTALDKINEGTVKRRRVYGILGKVEADGTRTVRVAGDPTKAHVQVQGQQAATTAFHRGAVNLDSGGGQPVIMWREDGQLHIEGYNPLQANEIVTSTVYARSDAGAPGIFDRFSSDTAGVRTVVYLAHITDADMVDHFGASIQMAIEDSAGVRHPVGFISAQRDGSDDNGRLVFTPMAAGAPGNSLIVWSNGTVQMQAYGAGVATFDANGLLTSEPPGSTDVAAAIWGAAVKTTPVDADVVGLVDTADANSLKKLSWANIKSTLKTYFDTVYAAIADLAAYALLAGRAGGQNLRGGTGASDNLTLESTSHATKGLIRALSDVYIGAGTFAGIAGLYLSIVGSAILRMNSDTSGNAEMRWMLDGSTKWVMGADRSDSEKLKFLANTGLSGSNGIVITPTAQLGVRTMSPATSAALEIAGTDGALLLPRLTTTQRNALTPANGMAIFNTTLGALETYAGGAWRSAAHQNHTTLRVAGVAGTAVELLPAGTVTGKVQVSGSVKASNGTYGSFSLGYATAGDTNLQVGGAGVFIYHDTPGPHELTLSVTAGGALQVQRTAGTRTYEVVISIIYL